SFLAEVPGVVKYQVPTVQPVLQVRRQGLRPRPDHHTRRPGRLRDLLGMARADAAATSATIPALGHIACNLGLDFVKIDDKLLMVFHVCYRTPTVGATIQSGLFG